jgi:bifunctional non-homologous end joining protein LigD
VVSKRKDSAYRPGRSTDWLKSKCLDRDEYVVGGYTPSRAGKGIGSLLVGHYEGKHLVHDGRVGTGFSAKQTLDLQRTLRKLTVEETPFHNLNRAYGQRAIWVRPKLVVEVENRGRSSDGLLRHASFAGLRADKPAAEVDRADQLRKVVEGEDSTVAGVKITHPSRVIDPTTGATKIELARYYAAVADALLIDMADRPLAVVRCPDGITGQTFFQRHPQATLAGRISTVKDPKDKEQLLCVRDETDLVTMVQFGVVEFHAWQTYADKLETSDRIIFDLDPAPEVPFKAVTLAARLVRERLTDAGLKSIVKTTGGKGLHVIVPLRPAASWAHAKGFARALAVELAHAEPKIFVATVSKAARKGRIYIDYLRNDRSSTAIAAYCARARPGLPVAMPIDWREVTEVLTPADYNIRSVTKATLPKGWRAAQSWRQSLTAARLKALGVGKE